MKRHLPPAQIQKCLLEDGCISISPSMQFITTPSKVEKYLLVFLGTLIQLPVFSHVLLSAQVILFRWYLSDWSQGLPFTPESFFLRCPLLGLKFCGNQSILMPCDCFPRFCISNAVAQFEHLVKTFKITQWKSFKQGAAVLEKKPAGCSPHFLSSVEGSWVFRNSRRWMANLAYPHPLVKIGWRREMALSRQLHSQSCPL